MPTILPKKVTNETPIAPNDEKYNQLVNQGILNRHDHCVNPPYGPYPYGPSPYYPDPDYDNDNAIATNAEIVVPNTNTDFINRKWRPLMAFVYMVTCICDFILFPVLWSMLQAYEDGSVTNQWKPLTLQGAGLFHLAMGAILGITAYGRTKEKLEGKA